MELGISNAPGIPISRQLSNYTIKNTHNKLNKMIRRQYEQRYEIGMEHLPINWNKWVMLTQKGITKEGILCFWFYSLNNKIRIMYLKSIDR